MTDTGDDFDFYREFFKSQTGLALTQGAFYVLESRLQSVAQAQGLKDVDAVTERLRAQDAALRRLVVEAMLDAETSFFRGLSFFHVLQNDVFPRLAAARRASGGRDFKIWSAGCGRGQEAYALAMAVEACAGLFSGLRTDILATDVSKDALVQAQSGEYSQMDVQRGLPARLLVRHFTQEEDRWKISENIRNGIEFRVHNLLEPLDAAGGFDVILCRNVLEPFEEAARLRTLSSLKSNLREGGVLFSDSDI